jgi:hypothetical protein
MGIQLDDLLSYLRLQFFLNTRPIFKNKIQDLDLIIPFSRYRKRVLSTYTLEKT